MNSFSTIYHIILDALFPLSTAESELFSMSPEVALQKLTPAPNFSGLAVPLPGARSVFAYKDERVAKLVWNIKYKKSSWAVKIGGYALLRYLQSEGGVTRRFVRGTPSASADAASRSPSARHESADSPSLGPKAPSESRVTPPSLTLIPKASSKSRVAPASPRQTLVIPIPITAQRRRERGYNQCELLVDEIERLNISAQNLQEKSDASDNHLIFEKNLLIRTQHVARQTLKGRDDRLESAKGIFGVNEEVLRQLKVAILNKSGGPNESLNNCDVIIIDDVITTGSTMYEAIETLKRAGYENVRALSLAH